MNNKNIEIKSKKESLLYNSSIKFGINEWVKILSLIWISYLIFNTKNPFVKIINTVKDKLLEDPSVINFFIIIVSSMLYLFLILLGVFWAVGLEGIKGIIGKIRPIHLWYGILFGILYILFSFIGIFLSSFIPYNFGLEYTNTLDIIQYTSLKSFILITINNIILIIGNELSYILVFLAIYQLFKKILPNNKVYLALSYIVGGIFAGVLSTTAYSPYIIHNIVEIGISQIPIFISYRKFQNIFVPIFAKYIFLRIFLIFYTIIFVFVGK